VFVLAAALVSAAATDARAEPNEGGAAAAESLFQEARKLMDAKRFNEACPKLVASHKIAPAVGTLLNLADCYEKAGQLASAWARFHEAIALAQRLNRPDREKTARERADKLEPRLIKLTIVANEPNIEVKLDGNVLDPAVLGTAVPVDSGKHTIDAKAKGKKPFNTTIDVSERAKSPSVEIPALEVDPDAEKTTAPKEEPKPPEEKKDGSTQRILGLAGMGLGVVGLGLGTVFGLKTGSKWSDAKTHCDNSTPKQCDAEGLQLQADARNAGTVSTVTFIAGAVFAAGGAALYFTAPSGSAKKENVARGNTRVGIGPGSVLVQGSF
jgi:hypothetical protein